MSKLYKFITYSGLAAFLVLTAGFFYGILGIDFKVHKVLGILAMAFASIHAGLILYKNIKMRSQNKT